MPNNYDVSLPGAIASFFSPQPDIPTAAPDDSGWHDDEWMKQFLARQNMIRNGQANQIPNRWDGPAPQQYAPDPHVAPRNQMAAQLVGTMGLDAISAAKLSSMIFPNPNNRK